MRLLVTTETRFAIDGQGRAVCETGIGAYRFWTRYLDVFDEVIVAARQSQCVASTGQVLEGPGVRLLPLADSTGVAQAVCRFRQWRSVFRRFDFDNTCCIARVPGMIGGCLAAELTARSLPFAAEVVGDPGTVFASGSFQHPLRPALRWWFCRDLRRICRQAQGAAYVTRHQLQQLYPTHSAGFSTHYSSVDLPHDAFRRQPRSYDSLDSLQLISVGTMTQRYKGQAVLLKALKLACDRNLDWSLTLVGDGRYRATLQQLAGELGIAPRVSFTGQLPAGTAVRERLDAADLFVLPSLTEGLPRALIEAQARALPCIASNVGGIPELLDASELVSAGDPEQLFQSISDLCRDPERMKRVSRENLQRAQQYSEHELRERRTRFYQFLRDSRLDLHSNEVPPTHWQHKVA